MSCKKSYLDKVYIFDWQIENFTFATLVKEKWLQTPLFYTEELQETKWYLHLKLVNFSNEYCVYCNLCRAMDDEGEQEVSVSYVMSIVSSQNTDEVSICSSDIVFTRGGSQDDSSLSLLQSEIQNKRSFYLPDDILRVRCRIWMGEECLNNLFVRYCAKTVIGCQRGFADWLFKCPPDGKLSFRPALETQSNKQRILNFDIVCYYSDYSLGIVKFNTLLLTEEKPFLTILKVGLQNSGNTFELLNIEEMTSHEIGNFNEWKARTTSISWDKCVMCVKESHYPLDILKIRTEFITSNGLVISSYIHGSESDLSTKSKNPWQIVNNSPSDFCDLLWENREKGHFCDYKLVTATSSFPVHRLVLSVRSEFFKSLFESDDTDKEKCLVDIDDKTIEHLMRYMYTSTIQLDWSAALKLFSAADKYGIPDLLNLCLTYLDKQF